MRAQVLVANLIFATAAMAQPDDLILNVPSWDQKDKVSGWFTDSTKIRALQKGASDTVPTRKVIDVAQNYLLKTFPEVGEKELHPPGDPFAAGEMAVKAKVKSWVFTEMSIHPIDLGRGRGTLISWKPEDSGQFYYSVKFRPEFNGRSTMQTVTVVLLPNLEIVPFRTIPITDEEKIQMAWWERHVLSDRPEVKEELLQSLTR